MEVGNSTIESKAQPIGPENRFNPFPGLRPFNITESHLFFGREGQSEEVLDNLSKNRFVGVIGASGSGKSSLMYCGLVPILHGGFITKAGSKWKIVASRPGSSPIDNLGEAIAKAEDGSNDSEDLQMRQAITSSILKSSSNGLSEAVKHMDKGSDENVLVMIDQFEELFRFRKSGSDSSYNEALAFVKLLLNAVSQEDVPIYVVITMRSDFIGECSQFQELTKLINDSHYLIPQMTRNDITKAIEGPVAVGGGKISHQLIQRLLNDIGDKQDQLPILQHALMRTWDYWSRFGSENEPMDVTHYEAIGTMERALSEHANEAYDELTEHEKEICVSVFKSLTERGSDNRGIRRPTRLSEIAAISQATEKEVVNVVETFRKAGRSFLTTGKDQVNSDSIIDISHESLMRIWNRLITWVEEEANAVHMYVRLSEGAAMFQEGKSGLWRPPDLQLAINWREKQKPTLTWAQRYAVEFERTMLFLKNSEEAYEAEERNKVKLQKKALKRSRIFALSMGVAAIFLLGVLVWAFMQYVEADTQRKKAAAALNEAEVQRQLALENADEAERNAKDAVAAQKEAEQKRLEAEDAKRQADLSAEEAKRQTLIAEQNAVQARRNAEEAKLAQRMAELAKLEAEAQKLQADKNADRAKKAKQDADNLRMLSIAQSMAVKSRQIRRDKQQKGLISYHAYLFNDAFGGEEHHSDVYGGLYDALKSLDPDKFTKLKSHSAAVRSVSTVDDNNFFSASSDGQIIKWTNNVPQPFGKEVGVIRDLSLSQDGLFMASANQNGQITVYNAADGSTVNVLSGKSGPTVDIEFVEENELISIGIDSTINKWNTTTKEKTLIHKGLSQVRAIAVSPNKRHLAAGFSDGSVAVWDLGNGDMKIISSQDRKAITSIRFSPKGKYLAFGDMAGFVDIVDARNSYKQLHRLIGHTARINDLAFSNDEKFFATASFDGTVQMFYTDDFDLSPVILEDHDTWVWSLDFSEDGNTIYTGSVDGNIQKFPTHTSEMADQMCNYLKRNMEQDEWEKYVAPDIPYEKTCK